LDGEFGTLGVLYFVIVLFHEYDGSGYDNDQLSILIEMIITNNNAHKINNNGKDIYIYTILQICFYEKYIIIIRIYLIIKLYLPYIKNYYFFINVYIYIFYIFSNLRYISIIYIKLYHIYILMYYHHFLYVIIYVSCLQKYFIYILLKY